MQVELEARGECGMTQLHWAALNGRLPVVQYLYKQGAEARSWNGRKRHLLVALCDRFPVVQYFEVLK